MESKPMIDYQAILKSAPDLYLILNPQLEIVDVSDAYLKATMVKREHIIGRGIFEVFPDNPNDNTATGVNNLRTSLANVLKNKTADTMAVQKYDIRRPTSEGGEFEEHYWSPVNSPVFGKNNEIQYIIHRVEDVTAFVHLKQSTTELTTRAGKMEAEIYQRAQEIQKTNQQLSIANEQLAINQKELEERNKKLKAVENLKNEFISVVSHELRTPLTSIRGSLGLVLAETVGVLSEKTKKLLNIANNNCDRLLLIINDILDIEKIEEGKAEFKFKVVNINEIVNEAITANKMYGEKFNVKIKLTQEISNTNVNVDPDRLMQALTNLISNAVKFSPQQGLVTLTIQQHSDTVQVAVTNNGAGIPEEFKAHIFQKFSQADTSTTREKGGAGLGLSISKSIIEKLGGTLTFKSIPDKETTFYFKLPIWHETIDEIQSPQKLLICEDDQEQAEFLKARLESDGFQTDIANTTDEAKKLLAKENYQTLLLDLILPGQDGIEFIKELRNGVQTLTLPIIVLSAIAKPSQYLIGGDAFSLTSWMDKPVDYDKLLKQLKDNYHVSKNT